MNRIGRNVMKREIWDIYVIPFLFGFLTIAPILTVANSELVETTFEIVKDTHIPDVVALSTILLIVYNMAILYAEYEDFKVQMVCIYVIGLVVSTYLVQWMFPFLSVLLV